MRRQLPISHTATAIVLASNPNTGTCPLGCCPQGDAETLRSMLNQGMSPNAADYDGRTGLMLAAASGHEVRENTA